MPEFFSHLVDVSKASVKKLKDGSEGMIKRVGSGISIHLSEANHAKCMKAYQKGKGCRLKLTADEIKQNDDEVSGSGFFKTLNKMGISRRQFTRGAKQAGQEVAKFVAPVINKYGKQYIPQLTAQLGARTGVDTSPLNAKLNEVLDKGTARLEQFGRTGNGFRPAGQSMIGSGIATLRPDYTDGYSNILPINHPIYNPARIKVGFGV
jgi:hypothetical protein